MIASSPTRRVYLQGERASRLRSTITAQPRRGRHRAPGRRSRAGNVFGRYYDPTTGQFISVDPLVDRTGESYVYASDDPTNSNDPSGDVTVYVPGQAVVGDVAALINVYTIMDPPPASSLAQLRYTVFKGTNEIYASPALPVARAESEAGHPTTLRARIIGPGAYTVVISAFQNGGTPEWDITLVTFNVNDAEHQRPSPGPRVGSPWPIWPGLSPGGGLDLLFSERNVEPIRQLASANMDTRRCQ